MSTWFLTQLLVNVVFGIAIFVLWLRLHRKMLRDDERIGQGLQILQSRISVLEDLSDRTEVQFRQMGQLLEQKARDVQAKIDQAEQQIQRVEKSMQRSLEVAEIFQDRIPHQEIIQRQSTVKYVKAAQLAHAGTPIDEIARQVDLPKGEIEFIAKVNREQLMFSVEDLPAWAQWQDQKRKMQEINQRFQEAKSSKESAVTSSENVAPSPMGVSSPSTRGIATSSLSLGASSIEDAITASLARIKKMANVGATSEPHRDGEKENQKENQRENYIENQRENYRENQRESQRESQRENHRENIARDSRAEPLVRKVEFPRI